MQSEEAIALAIESFNSGNREAFGEIYDAFVRDIIRYVSYRTEDSTEREEIVSDVFFRAMRTKHLPDDSIGLRRWLYRIARNAMIDVYRKRRITSPLEESENTLDAAHFENYADRIDNTKTLTEVFSYLDTIDSDHREILILRIWDDLSFADIAEITGKSEGNCKKIVSRTLENIRANIVHLVLLTIVLPELWKR